MADDAATPSPQVRTLAAADGTKLVVRTWPARGAAARRPPLVLCDGLGCEGYIWRYVVADHHGERPIVHMQYRGHGDSAVPADIDTLRVEVLVDDLVRVLDATGTGPAVFLGHSMGVQIVLETLAQQRHRVAGLGLLCGTFERPIDSWHGAAFADDDAPLGNRVMQRIFQRLTQTFVDKPHLTHPVWRKIVPSRTAYRLALYSELNPRKVRDGDFDPYLKHLSTMDMRVFARLAQDLAAHSARAVLPTIDVPTLVIGGGRDTFTPGRCSEEMAGLIPGAEFLLLVDGSHTAPIEHPRLVERALARLLARVDDAA